MKRLRITPLQRAVKAEVPVPGSKSYTNRALFIAALTPGSVRITNPLISDDTKAMIECLQALGISLARHPAYIEVTGDISVVKDRPYELNANLSGITLRFMLALCCVLPGTQTLRGKEGLNKRPIGDMVKALQSAGAEIEYLSESGYPPLRINSTELTANTVTLSGSTSSQYLSAMLMIAPAAGNLSIKVTGELISKPYVAMTADVMERFGVRADPRTYQTSGQYRAAAYEVEGDISSASYFFSIAALTNSTITVTGVNPHSKQADMGFLKILEQMGSNITYGTDSITVEGSGVKALNVNMQDCPDQAQALAVLTAFADGNTIISGIKSLRIKETERVKALEQELHKMGIKATSTADSLTIHGGQPKPAVINTYGDHRMAMAFAVAGTKLSGIQIDDPSVVNKTFPDFWKKLAAIGVTTAEIQPNIVLIGMRGSGKSTVARTLARKLGIQHIDLDEIMAQRLTLSTPEIVQKHGWDYFRKQEATIAEEAAAHDNHLISTGGGVILKQENVAALKQTGTMVLLRASSETLVRRLSKSHNRPPLTSAKSLGAEVKQVLKDRQSLYEAAADIIIDTDALNANQVVHRIIEQLGRET